MGRFTGILGLLAMLGLAYAFSTDRKAIRGKTVAWGLGLQIVFAIFVLKVDIGRQRIAEAGVARAGADGGAVPRAADAAILGMVLVLMGLSVILRDTNRNVIISSGTCVVLCAVFYVVCNACRMLGDGGYLSPALAGWLPVVLFAPFGVVMFDAVQT